MNKYYSIYIPSTYDIYHKIDNRPYKKQVINAMAKLFGEVTIYDTSGAWVAKDGFVVNEKISIAKSYCSDEQFKKNSKKIDQIARYLAVAMKQEAITIETQEGLRFI